MGASRAVCSALNLAGWQESKVSGLTDVFFSLVNLPRVLYWDNLSLGVRGGRLVCELGSSRLRIVWFF